MVRGLSLRLDIGADILPTCRPLCTFLAPFKGAQMPKTAEKTIFRLFWTISPIRMGLMIWLGDYFQV
jgi:hypothetical protein